MRLSLSFASQPKGRLQQDRVVWFGDLLPLLERTLSLITCTFGAQAFATVHTARNLIPDLSISKRARRMATHLEEKASVIWHVLHGPCVVQVVLVASVNPRMVGIDLLQLVTPVQIDAVQVEEAHKLREHQVDVGGHE